MYSKDSCAVLTGLAIGDALGMPFEKLKEEVHEDLKTWDGTYVPGTFHKLPAGHWTDDTEMALCLAGSLIEFTGNYSGRSTASRYSQWIEGTPHGAGGSTKNALRRLKEGVAWDVCGETFDDWQAVGSGTVMRVAPLGVVFRNNPYLGKTVQYDAGITHRHPEAYAAAIAVASMVASLLDATPQNEASVRLREAAWIACRDMETVTDLSDTRVFQALFRYSQQFGNAADPDLLVGARGNSYQITLSAIHSVAVGWNDFHKGIQAAIHIGGDTDTRAAVAGAMLGALHGSQGIPQSLKDGLHMYSTIAEIDQQLFELGVSK